jgi:hypothetical protein
MQAATKFMVQVFQVRLIAEVYCPLKLQLYGHLHTNRLAHGRDSLSDPI